MTALGHNPHRLMNVAVSFICLIFVAYCILNSAPSHGQDFSNDISTYQKPLNEQQRELGRIDDALKGGIQQIERACKPFIEEDAVERVELKPDTYLQLNQARVSIESKSNAVRLQFKNVRNVTNLKHSEICKSTTNPQQTDICVSLNFAQEKLSNLETYFIKTTTKNIQIFDNFIVVGKLEALNCVRPGFTNNLIQSYLRRVDETDISGLEYYQSRLNQLKSEIQSYE